MTQNIDKEPTLNTGFITYTVAGRRQLVELENILTIGREPPNQLQLADAFVSARHARIERRDLGFVLRDLRSRNGTLLNGSQITEAPLKDGDRIRIGECELIFSATAEAKSTPAILQSQNPNWQVTLSRLESMAKTDLCVLLTGPSGVGKEVVAKSLHELSSRAQGPLISVNCSALSESLIESELFGHVRGSFTGATHDRQGAFAAARGGTLFLDEIGDLPLSLQPKLLRALENAEIRPLGSDRTVKTDVRIVAATHCDLAAQVQSGQFRQDLYFRLNVIRLQIPALTQRLEDFDTILYYFAKQYRVRFSYAAIARLKEHSWPGNIRELRNLVARAKAYHGQDQILPEHLRELIDPVVPPLVPSGLSGERPLLKEIEERMIRERLILHHGNQRKVAADLGMPKSTLHDRIKTYGINIKELISRTTA